MIGIDHSQRVRCRLNVCESSSDQKDSAGLLLTLRTLQIYLLT